MALNADTEVTSNRTYSTTYTFAGSNAVDGTKDTGWCSATSEKKKEAIIVDMKELKTFDHIVLLWNAAHSAGWNYYEADADRPYTLSYSEDKTNWTTLKEGVSEGPGQIFEKPIANSTLDVKLDDAISARYIKFEMEKLEPEKDVAYVWEIGVYHQPDTYFMDASVAEINNLPIPGYVKSSFDVPLLTSFGATVSWESNNDALAIDSVTGRVSIKTPSENQECILTATVKYNDMPTQTVTFKCVVYPESGQLIDYKIYPEPQRITRSGGSTELTKEITLVTGQDIGADTISRAESVLEDHGFTVKTESAPSATSSNIFLDIYSPDNYPSLNNTAVAKPAVGGKNEENQYDAHVILVEQNSASNKGDIKIIGRENDGVYYGMATIDQMLDQMQANNTLSTVTIEDYANSQYRGVVEGFYGQPYTAEGIESLMRFGQKYKMNTFIYGPKADPYHASKWKEPYPTEASITEEERANGVLTQEDFREIAKVSDETHVNFVWSIHPMMDRDTRIDITDQVSIDQGVKDIVAKFSLMRELGIKGFGMFVDDVATEEVPVLSGAPKQAEIIGRVAADWKAAAGDDYRALFYVPTLYCFESYWPIYHVATNVGPLADLENLDDIILTFTGSSVFSPIENSAFDAFSNCLGADEYYKWMLWWNSPVNDGADDSLFMGPADQRFDMFTDVTNARGVISNPMQQSEASKVQIFGILDYAWNISDFDSQKSWEDSFAAIIEDDEALAQSLKIFAENSAPAKATNGTEKPSKTYSGLDEAVDALTENPSSDNISALSAKLEEWDNACKHLKEELANSSNEDYVALYQELSPWIHKAESQISLVQSCLNIAFGDNASISDYYTVLYDYAYLEEDPLNVVQTMEGTGTSASARGQVVSIGGTKFNQFMPLAVEWAEKEMEEQLPSISVPPALQTEVISNMDVSGIQIESTDAGYALTGLANKTLECGKYIGAHFDNFLPAMDLSNLAASLPSGVALQYSINARTWQNYTTVDESQPIAAIRLINLGTSPVTLTSPSLTFPYFVRPLASNVTTTIEQYQENAPERASDGDWTTFFWSGKSPAKGQEFKLSYENAFALKSLQVVFDSGDTINTEVAVEGSADGENWNALGSFNGSSGSKAQVVEKDGKTYHVYSILGLNTSVSHIRMTFAGNNGPWIKICEVIPNSAVPPVSNVASSADISVLFDGTPNTLFMPAKDSADTITYALLEPRKITSVDLYMYTEKNTLPQAEVLSNGDWTQVPLEHQKDMLYTLELSKLYNVSQLRLSWNSKNAPNAIYDMQLSYTDVKEIDKSALIKAYQDSLQESESQYSASAWQAFKSAQQAVFALINGEATEKDAADAVTLLQNAMEDKNGSSGGGSNSGSSGGTSGGGGGGSGSGSVTTKPSTPDEKDEGTNPAPSTPDSNTSNTSGGSFTDMQNHWAADAVKFVTEKGLFNGTSNNTFSPDENMTRAMLMTVMARLAGQDTNGGSTWYEKGMNWATSNGISDGSDPEGNITREQLVTMLYRYAGSPAVTGNTINAYADASAVSSWAQNAMLWAIENQIITGKGNNLIDPKGNATRAEVATILMRYASK